MRQGIAASISVFVIFFAGASVYKEKLSATEGGSILMAVLAYWAEPPGSAKPSIQDERK